MAAFLKIVSDVYLAFIWLLFLLAVVASGLGLSGAMGMPSVATNVLAFVICITLSIPAVALFAFGQVVGTCARCEATCTPCAPITSPGRSPNPVCGLQ